MKNLISYMQNIIPIIALELRDEGRKYDKITFFLSES
jgi:hypothetical protein